MKEATRFFNFQMPHNVYKKLVQISFDQDCSVAKLVREAIGKFLLTARCGLNDIDHKPEQGKNQNGSN